MLINDKKILANYTKDAVDKHSETIDGVIFLVTPEERTCKVAIAGPYPRNLVVAHYPMTMKNLPNWVKVGNVVKLMCTQGQHGIHEIVGPGVVRPMTVPGDLSLPIPQPPDVVIAGCYLIECPNEPQMTVLINVGFYRIDGVTYELPPIPMEYGEDYILGMGGAIESIAGAIAIDAPPAEGLYRYDAIVVGEDGIIDYLTGTPAAIPTIPTTPSSHVQLGFILVYPNMTEVRTQDINALLTAQIPCFFLVEPVDDELDWDEISTPVTVTILDQLNRPIIKSGYGWHVTLAIEEGNGTLTNPDGEEGTEVSYHMGNSNTCTYTYTRNQSSTDSSPVIRATLEIDYPLIVYAHILLLDEDGNVMGGEVALKSYYSKHITIYGVGGGTPPPQQITPSSDGLGGWRFNSALHEIYFSFEIKNNWDEESDIEVIVFFEINDDNTGGNDTDTVDFKCLFYFKGNQEVVTKTQTIEGSCVVGKSPQYKQFRLKLYIDHDHLTNPVEIGDLFNGVLNLETDTSEVDDIIINFIDVQYLSKYSSPVMT